MNAETATPQTSKMGKFSKPPKRVAYKIIINRELLAPDEVEKLMNAARSLGRHGHRDATLILNEGRL